MKLGLFGGTFDPPHVGHLMIMSQVADVLELDIVMMIPCAVPPHDKVPIASFEQRVEMCKMSLSEFDDAKTKFIVNDIEGELEEPSYTWRTITEIDEVYSKHGVKAEMFLILGTDEYVALPNWVHPGIILARCDIAYVPRKGFSQSRTLMEGERVELFDVEGAGDISSSMIRRRISENKTISHLVHPDVERFILDQNIYGEN